MNKSDKYLIRKVCQEELNGLQTMYGAFDNGKNRKCFYSRGQRARQPRLRGYLTCMEYQNS